MWLVRGDFVEGDDVIFNHDDAVRDAVDEKMRRREEIQWKEQILDRILGVQKQPQSHPTTYGDAGCGLVSGGFEDSDHDMGWSDGGDDTGEEDGQDSDTSVQSMVTHIRTPPHTFEFEDVPLVLGGGNPPAVEDSPSSHETFHSARSHHATPGFPSPPHSETVETIANPAPGPSNVVNQKPSVKPKPSVKISAEMKAASASTSFLSVLVKGRGSRLKLN